MMQSIRTLVFITFLLIDGFAEASPLKLCTSSDQQCVDANANAAYQMLITGIPSLGIPPHEPIFEPLIEGDLSIIKYKFFNSTFKGFDKCKISKVKINSQALKLHFEMFCPLVDFYGQYEINGRLVILPVEGKGTYDILTGNYKFEVDCELKIVDGHLNVKNYKIKSTALTAIVYDFKNLFYGQKDLSDAVHKFANQNWKEVADLVQDPVWYAHAKTFFSSANKFLNTMSLDEALPK